MVQQGPLYRTVGSHITIWCKVRGYQGPSEQNFQYSIYLPSAPDREVQVVSTQDPGFSYAIYSQRVHSGDIYVERVTGDYTLLHIRQLQDRDSGEYECHTPNTDPTFYGSYSAKVNLRVLPDTLRVTLPSQHLEKTAGSSLEVTCDVSRNSSRHTHLSVSWLLTRDKETEILALSRDFVLIPGDSFSGRFWTGDVRMDKLSDSSYRLSIKELQVSDQGDLFCQGSEWIQDPDGTWTKITEKKSGKAKLTVSALQGGDFKVNVQSKIVRSLLEITCSISGDVLHAGRFTITWLHDGAQAVTWDPSGVSSFRTEYRTREAKGQISIRRQDQGTWTLRVIPVTEQDGGSYLCDVTEEASKRRRQSTAVTVAPETPGPPLRNVSLRSEVSSLYEGDSLTLYCEVSGSSSSMDVLWITLGAAGHWVTVLSVTGDGEVEVARDYSLRHESGLLTAQRLSRRIFSLTFKNMAEADGGRYKCRLTERIQQPDETWRKETHDSNSIGISVQPLGAALEVALISRDHRVTSGAAARLFCRVGPGHVLRDKRLSWSWDFQPGPGAFLTLVNVSADGARSWGRSGFQGEAQILISGESSVLVLHRVQRQYHQGAYRCRLQVLTRDTSALQASLSSIAMTLNVQLPESRLLVDTRDRVVLVSSGQEEAVLDCTLSAVTPGTAHHVGWFMLPLGSSSAVNILNMTHQGLTSHHPSFSWFSGERLSFSTAVLRLLRPQLLGAFYCAVRELLLESGEWVTLAERTSGVTRVTLRDPGQTLKVSKQNVSLVEPVGGDVALGCPLVEGRSSAALYSMSWYYQAAASSPPSLVYRAGWQGVTEYKEALAGRLQGGVSAQGNSSLILRSVGTEDSGIYHCQVEEWRLQEDRWRLEASDTSGYLKLQVTAPGDRLGLNMTGLTLVSPESSDLSLPCHVVTSSTSSSTFSISWWKVRAPGPQLLLNASHLGQIDYCSEEGGRLQYNWTSELTFYLQILRAQLMDSGIYYCRVQEWVRTPRGGWYLIGQQSGGNMSVTIQAAGVSPHFCSPLGLFCFLLVVSVLFLLLLLALGWKLLTRRRNKTSSSSGTGRGFWSLVKTSKMEIDTWKEEEPKIEEAEHIQLSPPLAIAGHVQ
ncbi:immunoglobulin superfamily member 3-like isoform X2 [Engystomops pustulosus]